MSLTGFHDHLSIGRGAGKEAGGRGEAEECTQVGNEGPCPLFPLPSPRATLQGKGASDRVGGGGGADHLAPTRGPEAKPQLQPPQDAHLSIQNYGPKQRESNFR